MVVSSSFFRNPVLCKGVCCKDQVPAAGKTSMRREDTGTANRVKLGCIHPGPVM